MRQVDHVHDAEDQRQPGGEQEQHQAELQAVEALFDDEEARHSVSCDVVAESAPDCAAAYAPRLALAEACP